MNIDRDYLVTSVAAESNYSGNVKRVRIHASERGRGDDSQITLTVPINEWLGGVEVGTLVRATISTGEVVDMRPQLEAGSVDSEPF